MDKVSPFCRASDSTYCQEIEPTLTQFKDLVFSNKYKSVPMKIRLPAINALKKFGNEVTETITEMLGVDDCAELVSLVKSGRVKLYNFKSEFADDDYIREFYLFLKRSVKNSNTFPLFDDQSNNLIKSAINENPLVRFRSKALSYSDDIQSMPWDETFQHECIRLYQKEIAPEIIEIEELTRESGFLKNLGYNIISDNSVLKTVRRIGISIASAGAISAFSDIVSFDTAILATGGAYATSKIAEAYKEYNDKQKDIQKKDLYFYYKAVKLLKNKFN